MSKQPKTELPIDKSSLRLELAEEMVKDHPDQKKIKILARKCQLTLPRNISQQLGVTLLAMDHDLEPTDLP